MIIGEAEIIVRPSTAGFAAELEAQSQAGFAGVKKDAEKAGDDAGKGLRDGVRENAGRLEGDLGEAGLVAGASLRKGVGEETGKLGEDLEKDGAAGGERLSRGMSGGLSKLGSLIANTGLPLGGLSTGFEKAGKAAEDADHKSGGFASTLDKVGGVALAGVAGGLAVAAVGTVKLAEGMQTAEASIAGATHQTNREVKSIGDAFLDTAFKSRFTGKEMAESFAPVSAQLAETQGHVLHAGEALHVMSAASDLAEAKGISLSAATQTLTSTMQAFGLHTGEAAHVTDVLYSASNAAGVSVESFAGQVAKMRARLGDTAGSVGELSATIVDMTHQGITGRGAMSALNTGMNTLLKTADGTTAAITTQSSSYASLPPKLKDVADAYRTGALSSEQLKTILKGLPPAQEAALSSFAKASTKVQEANQKYHEMGVNVFDAQGKFVGMGSIIDQLSPKFAHMTEQQRLATASTLFGAGAARQLTAIIDAGPAAYQKATEAVEKHGAAQNAAKKYGETLQGEEKQLGAGFVDLGTKIGELLIPVLTKLVAEFTTATTFVLHHKEVLIALGALIAGPLTVAIGVFTVNKMAAFGKSFLTAGENVTKFAGTAKTGIEKVMQMLGLQESAATKAAAKAEAENAKIEASNATLGDSFAATATAAETASGEIGTAETATVGEVTAADGTIEADNAAAGASFTALLGPIAAVGAAIAAVVAAEPEIENLTGGKPASRAEEEGATGPFNIKKGGLERAQGLNGPVEEQVFEYFKKALGPIAAAGIAGNAALESSFNPNAPGGGLFQTIGGRGVAQGAPVGEQLESALKEIFARGEAGRLEAAKTPGEAAHIFESGFERPAGYNEAGEGGTAHSLQREKAAEVALLHYQHKAFTEPGGTPAGESPQQTAKSILEAAKKAEKGAEKTVPAHEANTKALEKNTVAQMLAAAESKSEKAKTPAGLRKEAEEAKAKGEEAQAKALREEAQAKKAGIEKEVKSTETAAHRWEAGMLKSETGMDMAMRSKVATEISLQKTYTAELIKAEKEGLDKAQAVKKAQAAKEQKVVEEAEKVRTTLETAAHNKSLAQLNTQLTGVTSEKMLALNKALEATHKAALEKLAKNLEQAWVKAQKEQGKLIAEKEKEAAEKREAGEATQIGKETTLMKDQADREAKVIEAAGKEHVEREALKGKTGPELESGEAQLSADEVTSREEQAISHAEEARDQAAGSGALNEARAARSVQEAQDTATVNEARAKAAAEEAQARATEANTKATEQNTKALNTETGAQTPISITIPGGSNMSAAELMSEVSWAVKTGGLPVAT